MGHPAVLRLGAPVCSSPAGLFAGDRRPSGRRSSYRIARRAAIFFLERRSAVAEPGRGRTFCFSRGRSRQVSVRQRWAKRWRAEKWGPAQRAEGAIPFFVVPVLVSSVPGSGVPDFSAALDVWRRTFRFTRAYSPRVQPMVRRSCSCDSAPVNKGCQITLAVSFRISSLGRRTFDGRIVAGDQSTPYLPPPAPSIP